MAASENERPEGKGVLKDQIYQEIKDDIIFGRMKPGDPLILQKICAEKNISTAPVREALSMLSKEGLVDLSPHKRAVVSRLQTEDFDTILFLRSTLEPYAARLSVGRIPREELVRIRRQLESVSENPEDIPAYIASDLELHELLHAYCGSPLLSELITVIKLRSFRLRYLSEHFTPDLDENAPTQNKVTQEVTQEHMQILDAFEAGDADLVENEVYHHIMRYGYRQKHSFTSD